MDPTLVLDPKLFDVFFVLIGGGEHQHHSSLSALIKQLSGFGAGLIQHWCQIDPAPVLDPKLFDVFLVLIGGGEYHTSLSSTHQAFIWHWCWIDPASVPDGSNTGAGPKVV